MTLHVNKQNRDTAHDLKPLLSHCSPTACGASQEAVPSTPTANYSYLDRDSGVLAESPSLAAASVDAAGAGFSSRDAAVDEVAPDATSPFLEDRFSLFVSTLFPLEALAADASACSPPLSSPGDPRRRDRLLDLDRRSPPPVLASPSSALDFLLSRGRSSRSGDDFSDLLSAGRDSAGSTQEVSSVVRL